MNTHNRRTSTHRTGRTARYGRMLFAVGLLGLAACRNELDVTVPLSALAGDGPAELPAALRVEVASCTSYEDSSRPSRSLGEAVETVRTVLPGAHYTGCARRGMDSFARFELAVAIDREADQRPASTDTLNLLAATPGALGVHVPAAVSARLAHVSRNSLFGDASPTIRLTVVNDTGQATRWRVLASFVGGHPVVEGIVRLPAGHQMTVRLSDVAAAAALKGLRPVVLSAAAGRDDRAAPLP